MNKMLERLLVLTATLVLLLVGATAIAQTDLPMETAIPPLPAGIGDESGHDIQHVFDVLDDAGTLITQAAITLVTGDSYIDRENTLWEVTAVDGRVARVANRGKAEMPDVRDARPRSALQTFLDNVLRRSTAQADRDGVIGIYHTHSAESYEASSGTAFKDRGDVFEVGEALKQELESRGFTVVLSDRGHLPHDAGAYQRSRRTAAELSQERPVTLIDVHRDAIPDPDAYRVNIEGTDMSGVRIVVGRQNQNREANLEYAKRIKAIADEKFPGLIIGIFHAHGNYNQDLGPRMILLEFGTHTTTLEEAKRSTKFMAEILPAAAGLAPGTRGAADSQIGGAASKTIWWILGLVAIGAVGWLLLNREGLGLDRLLRGGGNDGGDQG